MSIMINNYLIEKHKLEKLEGYYGIYFPFIESCRKVTRNITKVPSIRMSWDNEPMKTNVETYSDFLEYLKDGDNKK